MQIEMVVKAMNQGYTPLEMFPGFDKPWKVKDVFGNETTIEFASRDLDPV